MNGPTPTNIDSDDWVFNLAGDDVKPTLANDGQLVALLGESDRWSQYENKLVYELDSLVRQWIIENSKHAKWKSHYMCRRYTMRMVYEQIYNKPYEPDGYINSWLPRILTYYSTRVQKGGSIYGKTYSTRTIYTISPARIKKPPYSLKLRLEWFAENDIMPTYSNMSLVKDKLKPGHARNPRTNANMVARSERAKARYREKYADRDH